jgi:hypothetical protein
VKIGIDEIRETLFPYSIIVLVPKNENDYSQLSDKCYTKRFMFKGRFDSRKADLVSNGVVGSSVTHDDGTHIVVANLTGELGILDRYTFTETPEKYANYIKGFMPKSHNI